MNKLQTGKTPNPAVFRKTVCFRILDLESTPNRPKTKTKPPSVKKAKRTIKPAPTVRGTGKKANDF